MASPKIANVIVIRLRFDTLSTSAGAWRHRAVIVMPDGQRGTQAENAVNPTRACSCLAAMLPLAPVTQLVSDFQSQRFTHIEFR
jgi:hypothetical protein